jgi:anti-sigma B factor antagonist
MPKTLVAWRHADGAPIDRSCPVCDCKRRWVAWVVGMPDDVEPSRGDELRVEARAANGNVTIVLEGEFDMMGTELFWAHVSETLAARPRSIAVEAHGLEFIDSAGLMALVRAREAALAAGVRCRLINPSPEVRRIAELCGLDGFLLEE